MSEVCQPGVEDWGLPSWCVDYDLGASSFLQLALELFILVLIFMISYAYFDWRKKKKNEKDMVEKMKEESPKSALHEYRKV
tara:strand:- start:336 stop:578 length:243 start_codon:yes stop_codon:yes gene_type:complete